MYKVFVNDTPIILTDSAKSENDFPTLLYNNTHLDEIVYKLTDGGLSGVNLYCIDLPSCWEHFKTYFSTVVAAGGLVKNAESEFLFISRFDKWDLPKGRIEANETLEETAIREVEEECGITELELQNFLVTTYHLFNQNNSYKLKETHWYFMTTNYQGTLTPQLEEGITNVVFKSKEEVQQALLNSYANIAIVIKKQYSDSRR